MPTDLLQKSFGIPRSLLEQITAVASSVKSGTTFMGSDGTIQTGTLSLSGNASTGNVQSGKTFYSNSWTKQTGTLALSGNAGTVDVLSGKTFYSNSFTKQTGTLKANSSYTLNYNGRGNNQSIPNGSLAIIITANLGNSSDPNCTNVTNVSKINYKSSEKFDQYSGGNTPSNKYSLWMYLVTGNGNTPTVTGAEWCYVWVFK